MVVDDRPNNESEEREITLYERNQTVEYEGIEVLGIRQKGRQVVDARDLSVGRRPTLVKS